MSLRDPEQCRCRNDVLCEACERRMARAAEIAMEMRDPENWHEEDGKYVLDAIFSMDVAPYDAVPSTPNKWKDCYWRRRGC